MQFRKLMFQGVFWRSLYFLTVFVLNILIARYFEASGTGSIFYITNLFCFILLMGSLSLETAMTYYGSKGELSFSKLSWFSFAWSFLISVLIFLILYFTQSEPVEFISRKQFLVFAFIYSAGILLTTFFSALFYARQDVITPNLVLSFVNVLLILVFPIFQWLYPADMLTSQFLGYYFYSFLLQGLLVAGIFLWKCKAFENIQLPATVEYKKLISYSFYALAANVIFFLLYRIDYWFVKNMCPVCREGDLGNYIQVSKLGQMFLVLPAMFASMIFPQTAAGFKEQVNHSMQVLSRMIFNAYLLILLFIALTGYRLFPFIFGESFMGMYSAFLWLAPGILSLSLLAILSAYNAGKNRVIVNLTGALIALVIIVAGDILLIPRYGIIAAAQVSSIGYASNLVYALYHFSKEYKLRVGGFFFMRKADVARIKNILSKPKPIAQ